MLTQDQIDILDGMNREELKAVIRRIQEILAHRARARAALLKRKPRKPSRRPSAEAC